jgi:hypothetical protein
VSSPLAALYNAAPIILWVEDLTTSAYLSTIWRNDSRIKLLIGGGHETLAALVEDERRNNKDRHSIYSLRDRDFGSTNRPRWRADDTWQFALETFEVECFLLDPAALASCAVNTAAKTESWIHTHLEQQGRDLLWWMACRAAIAGLRDARQQQFPEHPKRGKITCQADAETVLFNAPWVLSTVPGLQTKVSPANLRADLVAAHQRYAAHFAAGTWIPHVSGKELLGDLDSRIYTRGRRPGDTGRQDLAKAVAEAQLRMNRVPAELQELHAVLLERLARGVERDLPAAPTP